MMATSSSTRVKLRRPRNEFLKRDSEMAKVKGSISAKMKEALTSAHKEARQRVIERGTVHFRLTPESMGELLRVADKYEKPYGTMCREWVEYHLELETQTLNDEADIFKPVGKTMVCALHPESKKAQ